MERFSLLSTYLNEAGELHSNCFEMQLKLGSPASSVVHFITTVPVIWGKFQFSWLLNFLVRNKARTFNTSDFFSFFLVLMFINGEHLDIYRVSLKKVGLVFRARFEVFRGLRSKKFRRLRFYLLEHVFDQI